MDGFLEEASLTKIHVQYTDIINVLLSYNYSSVSSIKCWVEMPESVHNFTEQFGSFSVNFVSVSWIHSLSIPNTIFLII